MDIFSVDITSKTIKLVVFIHINLQETKTKTTFLKSLLNNIILLNKWQLKDIEL